MNIFRLFKSLPLLLLMLLVGTLSVSAQGINASGRVVDSEGMTIIGASVVLSGNNAVGTTTDIDGNFAISVPKGSLLEISYMGMKTRQVAVTNASPLNIVLENDSQMLEEVVIVGYGQQKKASVVGAITQASGEVLSRTAGVTDIGNALQGNLPGVVAVSASGMPGEEEPQITIRGSSSWNNSAPLVLVDGIEREMSSVDMGSVESISVLKDASATAVYGVKGANGVILITTKRGEEGKAKINVSAVYTMKRASYLPEIMDSYDALTARNRSIEYELALAPDSWGDITPGAVIDKYRNPANITEAERYPNIDWQDVLLNDFASSYTANLNASGGNKIVKYFASVDYAHEGDLFKTYDSNRGYQSKYSYDRINVRSNLDFKITSTTTFKMNIAGSTGIKHSPYINGIDSSKIDRQWKGLYATAPDAFVPIYSDGSYGYSPVNNQIFNSIVETSLFGAGQNTFNTLNTDFQLVQDLKFITKGLKFNASVSWDNKFTESGRGINDYGDEQTPVYKYIYPDTGAVKYKTDIDQSTGLSYNPQPAWSTEKGSLLNGQIKRNLNYQMQLYWGREYGKHDVSAMGLFKRSETANSNMIPENREDWAFRTTYSYDNRYFVEYNGAYNGSEKFSPEYRFAFFNSGAIGWMVSEEKFMDSVKFVDMLKIRASYGEIGDDNISDRWLYLSTWSYGGKANYYTIPNPWGSKTESIYTWYKEASAGNPDVHWETVRKLNLGIDYSLFNSIVSGSFELFRDNRRDILVAGKDRAVPAYLGIAAPIANLGRVESEGYEFELRLNKKLENGVRLWSNFNMTHARNEVLEKSDPELLPNYQKDAGYSIGQVKSYLDNGYYTTFDQLYGSTEHNVNDNGKLPGGKYIIDFNADGIIDSQDSAPYGYTGRPENTYNGTLGAEYKGFSFFAQFYGVTNVLRQINLNDYISGANIVFNEKDWWSPENMDADKPTSRWTSKQSSYAYGTTYQYDASYIRLRNVELAYTFNSDAVGKLGFNYLKIYVNGNNLWSWSRMPDDRESNFSGGGNSGAYPTMKRVNLGVKFSL